MPLVVQISDVHLRRTPADPTEPGSPDDGLRLTVAAVDAALAGRPADLVLVTGDIADDGSIEACARTLTALAPLGAPVVATPGNHDDPAAVARVFGEVPSVDVGAWRVQLVDSVIAGEVSGAIDVGEVVARLGAAGGRPTVLALHHPLVTLSTHPMFQLDGAGEMVAGLVARPSVRAVVSGHLHEAFEVHLGGVAHLGAPSTWYALRHEAETFRVVDGPTGARLIDLRDDGTLTWHLVPR